MIKVVKTDKNHPDFIELVRQLDAYLTITDGDDHDFYDQYNGIENIKHAIVLYKNEKAVACGAIKKYEVDTVEVKRMYTSPEHRGEGLASQVLAGLEKWASEMNYTKCILETGVNQVEAIRLYPKIGYKRIPNFGPYVGVENSVCFAKQL